MVCWTGLMGLNSIKSTDWLNVIVQALVRVGPLRDFFLIDSNYAHVQSALVHQFGELMKKIWNFRSFKGHVSPHELLQAVAAASNKQFRIGEVADPLVFLSWFLNTLHRDLALAGPPTKNQQVLKAAKHVNVKTAKTIITDCFQGEIEIISEQPKLSAKGNEKR